ncbi:MAG: hypothetical protein UU06_C0041G0009, partial [Parcubacteria group bacterium GW2011_GWB1_40_5]
IIVDDGSDDGTTLVKGELGTGP